MRRARIGSLVIRAYPRSFRAARGEEMLGTLLDAGEDSTGAFIRGVGSLLIGGLRERARENAQVGAGRLVADGFCLAAVLWTLLELINAVWITRANSHLPIMPFWKLVLPCAVLVFSTAGRDRIAGFCGLTIVVHQFIRDYGMPLDSPYQSSLFGHPGVVFFIDSSLGPLVCFTVMVLRPRLRSQDPRKLLWLVPVAALLALPTARWELIPVEVALCLGMPAVAIILLPIDPRLAITSAVLWADLVASATLGHTRLGLITLPIVLLAVLITVGRGKLLRVRAG